MMKLKVLDVGKELVQTVSNLKVDQPTRFVITRTSESDASGKSFRE
jgi:hypothetical protein